MKTPFSMCLFATAVFVAAASCVAAPLEPVLKVSAGFSVERVYVVPREKQGSWVSLCADARGVLYASDQYGPVYRIQLGRPPGGENAVRPLKLPIGGVHGLTWVGEELYAVVGQRDICEPGLYRLRDGNRDGELDSVELLRALQGEGEHGPHAVAASADGRSLIVVAGNGTRLPELRRSRAAERWREDSLLPPLPALVGSETRGLPHGGWICRTDRDGRDWELVCMGLRNAYSVACDKSNEVFTFDSDTEFDLGMPWYRPTRVLHCVSGVDFGWRRGALKVHQQAPDTLPPLLSMGLGSPTAVVSGAGTAFPARYREALFVADWCFGRLHAVHLRRAGAGFTAESEEIVAGIPLPITAACVNPRDGALYFVTGGRKTESALYRVMWGGLNGEEDQPRAAAVSESVQERRRLESYHGRADERAVSVAWPLLSSDDAVLRHAARVAIEWQPIEKWQDRALAEREPRAKLAALLALARTGDAALQSRVVEALEEMDWHSLGALRAEWVRVSGLAFTRLGGPSTEQRSRWDGLVSPRFPSGDRALDAALCELLVFLEAPEIAARAVSQLHGGNPREQQLHYARCLSAVRVGWTAELGNEFADWFGRASAWRGGASFAPFLQRIRGDAVKTVPEDLRAAFEQRIAVAAPTSSQTVFSLPADRGLVREWKLAELLELVEEAVKAGNADEGRKWFAAAGCAACHTFAGEGGAVGSDLTAVTRRMTARDLLEAIVDPNKEISDQYGTVVVTRRDGSQVQGRIVNFNAGTVQVCENLLDPANVTRIPEGQIESIARSKVSLMPARMLNVLAESEIVDLLAYLKSGVN